MQECDQCYKPLKKNSFVYGLNDEEFSFRDEIFCSVECMQNWLKSNLSYTKYKFLQDGECEIIKENILISK